MTITYLKGVDRIVAWDAVRESYGLPWPGHLGNRFSLISGDGLRTSAT